MSKHSALVPDGALWRVEVGFRAAVHSQSRQRDMRWFRGLWNRR